MADTLDDFLLFQRRERVSIRIPTCTICGHNCDGDTTIRRHGGEVPVCNEEDQEACNERYEQGRVLYFRR